MREATDLKYHDTSSLNLFKEFETLWALALNVSLASVFGMLPQYMRLPRGIME